MFFMILAIIAKVLLTILKILLFLFVFLVFVIGLILFVPVRYKTAGRYYENEKTFKLRLSWLLHIVSFRVESDGREVSYILRIFGVKVFPGKQKREKKNSVRKKKSKVKKKEKSKQKPVEEKNSEKFETSKAEEENKEKSETLQIEEQRVDSAQIRDNQKKEIKSEQDNKTDKENKFSKNQKEETGKSKKIFDKILTIIKKVSGFFKNLINNIKNLINNIKSLINTAKKMLLAIKAGSEKAKLVKEFVLCDESRNMVCFVRDNMLHLWKHVKPKYLYTDITFGFDNPELTGKVLGAAAAFCAMAGFKPGLTPDFEQSILEGKIEVKGRITFVVLLKIAIRVWLSEEVKSFRKEYNNIREVL